MIKIHGIRLSPFVRKVWILLRAKQIPFETNEITPFAIDEEYRKKLHPLGKIPCLEDGEFILPDSSAICNYLESIHPNPSFLPSNPKDCSRALWLEEYFDSEGARVFGLMYFYQRFVKPNFLKEEPDEALVTKAIEIEIPKLFSYLKSQLGENSFLFGDTLSLADIAFFTQVRNAALAGFSIDPTTWPEINAYYQRISEHSVIAQLIEEEGKLLERMR